MFQTVASGSCTLIVRNELLESETTKLLKNYQMAIFCRDFQDLRSLTEKTVSDDQPPMSFFVDEIFDLYLSHYDECPELLEERISAVLFTDEDVRIVFERAILKCKVAQIHSTCRDSSFFSRILLCDTTADTTGPPVSKKPRLLDIETDLSSELGIRTSDLISSSSDSPPHSSFFEPAEIVPRKQPLIKTSKVDARLAHRLEIDECVRKLDDLVHGSNDRNEVKLIPTSKIVSSAVYNDNDPTITSMVCELNDSEFLKEFDPVVVVERDSKYEIISGSRRFHAFKISGNAQMRVEVVRMTECAKFKLRKILRTFIHKKNDESNTAFMINSIKTLLDYINLSSTSLLNWTCKEMESVFGRFFLEKSKGISILNLFKYPQLVEAVEQLDPSLLLGALLLNEILMKFKINPSKTLLILSENTNLKNDCDLRKAKATIRIPFFIFLLQKLRSVKVDAEHILLKKKVPSDVVNELIADTDLVQDPQFSSFSRSVDLRKRTITSHLIKKMFDDYKEKHRKTQIKQHIMLLNLPNCLYIQSMGRQKSKQCLHSFKVLSLYLYHLSVYLLLLPGDCRIRLLASMAESIEGPTNISNGF